MMMSLSLSTLLLSTWLILLVWSPTEAFAPSPGGFIVSTTRDGDCSTSALKAQREVDLCIIGAGISGLAAAIAAAEKTIQQSSSSSSGSPSPPPPPPPSILILESDSAVGGRVRSDRTDDGYTLDRGFAVFVEEYPQSKKLLDYDALGLKRFLPGARVKLAGRVGLACVSDPSRRPRDLFRVVASPVGSPADKARLLPLFYSVMTKDVDELFAMEETDTLSCLRDEYNFSEEFISCFFAPFLEGIYLAPLEEQSSRMFHFVMKMFTIGVTSLPAGGMQAAADQLGDKASELGAEIRFGSRALSINHQGGNGSYLVEVDSKDHGKQTVNAKSVIIATDVRVSEHLLQGMNGIEQSTKPSTELPQRSVGCVYYAFRSPAPLTDPILVLNGEGSQHRRNTKDYPINNVCFPSVVQESYAPDGYELCSVSVLEKAFSGHAGDNASLDAAVRNQLSSWFSDYAEDIMDESKWIQKGVHVINNAQPVHYGNDESANVHGGRACTNFRGMPLPSGVFVCGDHMATSTFNGALESGVNAGDAAESYLAESCNAE